MKISDFLKLRGTEVITIGPDETAFDALKKMVENNIGALPVCDEYKYLLGIISERDLLKGFLKHGTTIDKLKVRDLMTEQVAVGHLTDDLTYAGNIMNQKRIRHMPIVSGPVLISIISVRDIVDKQLQEVQAQVKYAGMIKNGKPHF